jgi:hypothetical protein
MKLPLLAKPYERGALEAVVVYSAGDDAAEAISLFSFCISLRIWRVSWWCGSDIFGVILFSSTQKKSRWWLGLTETFWHWWKIGRCVLPEDCSLAPAKGDRDGRGRGRDG